jgi:hypothetical protein
VRPAKTRAKLTNPAVRTPEESGSRFSSITAALVATGTARQVYPVNRT